MEKGEPVAVKINVMEFIPDGQVIIILTVFVLKF